MAKQKSVELTAKKIEKIGGKRQLVSGAVYWDFKENSKFIGIYQNDVIGKDPQDPTKEKVIGYSFVDNDGILWVITSAYAVSKALETQLEDYDNYRVKDVSKEHDVKLEIIWLEKIERDGKPSYNRFEINLLG
jgi:hypothetical protein